MKYLLIDIENQEDYQIFTIINQNKRLVVKSLQRLITDLPVVISGEIKDNVIVSPTLHKFEEIISYLPKDENAKSYWKEVANLLIEIKNKKIRRIIAEEINSRKEKYIYYPLDLKKQVSQCSFIKRTIKLVKMVLAIAPETNLNQDILISLSLLYYTGAITNKLALYDPEIREDNTAYVFFRIKEKFPKEYICIKKISEIMEEI